MLTSSLDIPNQPSEQPQGWSVKRLLSMGGSVGKVLTAFNPFEFVFFVMILISGLAELLGRSPSWFWYGFLFLVLLVAFSQRSKVEPQKETKTESKPK